ncbi:hypothetical protein K0M31_017051 [Melipona bicolor]|uniref:Uncharacterized protein n=1 Tax=Melipona bicolor TaxID=60889 RepID=A0AA40FDH9_9HYME|nr:hypothetical protein K0M31_017051 [Melipona bicolor]
MVAKTIGSLDVSKGVIEAANLEEDEEEEKSQEAEAGERGSCLSLSTESNREREIGGYTTRDTVYG